jgi:hypothetical protein
MNQGACIMYRSNIANKIIQYYTSPSWKIKPTFYISLSAPSLLPVIFNMLPSIFHHFTHCPEESLSLTCHLLQSQGEETDVVYMISVLRGCSFPNAESWTAFCHSILSPFIRYADNAVQIYPTISFFCLFPGTKGYIFKGSKVYAVGVSPILAHTSEPMLKLYKSSRIKYCMVHCIYLVNKIENPEIQYSPYYLEILTNKEHIIQNLLQYINIPIHKTSRISLDNLLYKPHSLLFIAFCMIYNKSKKHIPILGPHTRLNIAEFVSPQSDIHTKMQLAIVCTRAIESCLGCPGLFQPDWIHQNIIVSPIAPTTSKKRKRC